MASSTRALTGAALDDLDPEGDALTEVASAGLTDVPAAAERLQGAIRLASRGLVEREVLVELIALSAVAEEHLLVIGEPGTAKREAERRVARALGRRYFE